MNDQLISFKTAVLAKYKGFNFDYVIENKLTIHSLITQSLLQKWLRETYNCFVEASAHSPENGSTISKSNVRFQVEVNHYGKDFEISFTEDEDFFEYNIESHEQALELGLQEGLKLIK